MKTLLTSLVGAPTSFGARARLVLPCLLLLSACASSPESVTQSTTPALTPQPNAQWFKLPTEAYKGKQDDIFFINAQTGFYGNGAGKIFKTTDGGQHWTLVFNKPGTYVRSLGFVDDQVGFAGNLGTEYFPGVTDTTPLYRTTDGGATWSAVTDASGPEVRGLCAIDILKTGFINAGFLQHHTIVHAAGRVGGPAYLMRSLDGGSTWKTIDMNPYIAAITDVKFFDEMNGLGVGSDDSDIERSHAVVVTTHDGGQTWQRAYTSSHVFQLAWKASFPSRNVGYVTVQDYNEDKTVTKRIFAKSVDGGKTWQEMPLTDDFAVREFGVGFADEQTGWIGTTTSGFATSDGGKSWQRVNMGRAINKIRIVPDGTHYLGYAIGVEAYKFGTPPDTTSP